ncbi:glycosyltransferase [Calditerricola satsumensis]|uniref:glycosyltransferase n=2 Tax=Calditerricola satsumensis TaxID=373054 RepID=UPI001667E348|nr:glycosyltransferase [Calditerricola satsumensis]
MGVRNLLLVAYFFPPVGGGGVQRALKMAKYLPEFGWRPHVLAVDPVAHVSLDPSLLDQLPPEVVVHRVPEWVPPGLAKLVARGGGVAPGGAGGADRAKGGGSEAAGTRQGAPSLAASLRARAVQLLKTARKYVLIPDDQILWYIPAVREGKKMLARYPIDAVLSTAGPNTNHLVALALLRRRRLPWVADFRDPWTQNMHRSGIRWREALEARMERRVMATADVVLTVTRSFAEGFREKHGDVIQRLEVIHNGFDAADYVGIEADRVPGKCVFAYAGIFYKERNPRLFLRAVRELIDAGEIDRRDILLRFAGVFDYPGYTDNADAVAQLGLSDVVEVLGHLPHRRALALLKGADVLLLVGDTAPGSGAYIPGKLFEYMAVQRPILALTLPGEAASIVERFRLGEVVRPDDLPGMKRAVASFYRRWKAGQLQQSGVLPPEAYALYERREQARALAALLDELTMQRKPAMASFS